MANEEPKENFGWEIPEGMTYYYLAILKKGPTWIPGESPELDRLQAAHVANYRRLAEDGKLIASGPLIDNGFIRGIDVFRTQSLAEAKHLGETDPMAQSQRLVYEFHPWMIMQDVFVDPDQPRLTDREWQKKTAIDLFNQTWELIKKPDRTTDDDLEMIHRAHASRYLWGHVGTETNRSRGEWQIAHVYTSLNRAEPALYHAKRCLEICETNHIGDFDLAFAYEALARAQACAGDRSAAQQNYRLAETAGEKIAEQEDRDQFKHDLAQGPWFDLI